MSQFQRDLDETKDELDKIQIRIEYGNVDKKHTQLTPESTLEIFLEQERTTKFVYEAKLSRIDQDKFDDEFKIINIFLSDILIVNYQITKFELIEACERFKINKNKEAQNLKMQNDKYIQGLRDKIEQEQQRLMKIYE